MNLSLIKKAIPITFFCCALFGNEATAKDKTSGVFKRLESEKNTKNQNFLSGILDNRAYYTDTFDSNNPKNEHRDAFLKSKLNVDLNLNDNFSVRTIFKFDKAAQSSEYLRRNQLSRGGGDQSFENEGLFIDELVFNYDYKNFSGLAGKFTANFGDAWLDENGIWVNQISKRYKQDEKLGLGIIARAGDKKTFGEYVFAVSLFTNDRKNLDNSIITKRDGTPKSDGEVGDTRSLKSYALSSNIYYDFGGDEKLSYHFSYLNLAINDEQNSSNIPAKINDENAFAANMNYDYPLNKNFLLKSFIEYVQINNLGGNVEKDSKTLTVNLTAKIFKDFFITLAKAKEKEFEIGKNGVDRQIKEISLGYEFDNLNKLLKGLSLSIGYKEDKIDDKSNPVSNKSFGFLVRHKIEF